MTKQLRLNDKMFKKTKLATLIGAAGLLALQPSLHAQDEEQRTESLEEIVVTATKRDTSLLETALAVTALSQEQLDKEGIDSVVDIENLVPNLQIALSPTDSGVQIAVRGLSSNNFTELGDPTVGVHFDGLFSPRPQGGLALLHDVERIDILRGPQGTLFGRNSTAGSINAISKRPEFGKVSGNIAAEVGNFEARNVKGWLNVPVNDQLAFRGSFLIDQADAWLNQGVDQFDLEFDVNQDGDLDDPVDIVRDGIPNVDQRRAREVDDSEAYSAVDRYGFRISGRWQPTENLEWNLIYDFFQDDGPGDIAIKDCDKAAGTFFACDHDLEDITVNVVGERDLNINTVRSIFEYQLNDSVLLEHRVAFSSQTRSQVNDSSTGDFVSPLHPAIGFTREATNGIDGPTGPDGEFLGSIVRDQALLDALGFPDTVIAPFEDIQLSTSDSRFNSLVTELQFKSTSDGPLQWIAGLFYLKEDNAINFEVEIPFCCGSIEPQGIAFVQPDRTVESIAGFTQFDYNVTDRLNLTLGVRYTYDRKEDRGGSVHQTTGFSAPNPGQFFDPSFDERGLNPLGFVFLGLGEPNIIQADDLLPTDGTLGPDFTTRVLGTDNSTSDSWQRVTWRVGADYEVNENLFVFGSVATGYKAGGFGDVVFLCDRCGTTSTLPFEPEDNITFEIGAKASLLGGRLHLLGNVFYSSFTDLQQTSFETLVTTGSTIPFAEGFEPLDTDLPCPDDPSTICETVTRDIGSLVTQNIADATSYGVELEFNWIPWAGGRIFGWAAYLNAEIDDFETGDGFFCLERALLGLTNCAPEVIGENGDPIRAVNFAGNKLTWSPEFSATVNFEHKFYLGRGYVLSPSASVSYQSDIFFDLSNFDEGPFHSGQPAFATGNAALSFWSETQRWGVSAFVNNVTDELIRNFGDQGPGFIRTNFGRPRTFGVRVNYDF